MNKKSFTIREMSIDANFYLKDLNVLGDNKQYWQYTISNIDYYIPNFGHLLLFDHNYKDLTDTTKKNKIIMEIFNDDNNDITTEIYNNAINCFNWNNFGSDFTKNGGVGLSSEVKEFFELILNKLRDLQTDLTNSNSNIRDDAWNELIFNLLKKYVHNRVGTYLRDLEINYIKLDETSKKFKPGELVIYEESSRVYKILLFIKIDSATCTCLNKNNDIYEEMDIHILDIYHYSEFETIKQDIKPGEPIAGQENILERYII